jgi:Fe-S-cluster containining protein
LTPDRNIPCPCGSGKKYKKCCGLIAHPGKAESISANRTAAYAGAVGRQREIFCLNYAAFKKEAIRKLEAKTQREMIAEGKTIYCSKGCGYCCSLYIEASLQECECIVHYLYQNEEALQRFLQAFEVWRERVTKIERFYNRIIELHTKYTSGLATEEEKKIFEAAGAVFMREHLSCPLLFEATCSVYEVRPYVCASMVSITPAGWCNPSHSCHNQVTFCQIPLSLENDMPYFLRPAGKLPMFNLPLMVYRILEQGHDALTSVLGFDQLSGSSFGTTS